MDLSDRMKKYEDITRNYLIKRVPVIVRVDGRAFHTLLKGTDKPFDRVFVAAMIIAAEYLAKEMAGFKLAYVQSDEASFLLTDYDNLDTQGWFNYNISKMISIAASQMTASFNYHMQMHHPLFKRRIGLFDARAFNMPREEVANYFLWRAWDWKRNSLVMYARSFYSHKELMNKNCSDIRNMLFNKGKIWSEALPPILKNGTWWMKNDCCRHDILPTYADINEVVEPLIKG